MKTTPFVVGGFAILSLSSLAVAGLVNWDDAKPYDYATAEREIANSCDGLNKAFGANGSISCSLDRASFDKHLALQLKIPKYSDRDPNDPYGYCVEGVFTGLPDYSQICKKGQPEFVKLVKKVVCRYQEGQKETDPPKVELGKDGTLTINVYHGSYVGHGYGWIADGYRKVFPIYDGCVKAHE